MVSLLMHALLCALLWLWAPAPAHAQEEYGAKGLYPVYETGGQWLIFDKNPKKGMSALALGNRFLVVGSAGAEVFEVARTSATYGGICRNKKPARLRAALLRGPRRGIGSPILGIAVPRTFTIKGSRARYTALENGVGEHTYHTLDSALKDSALSEVKNGMFAFKLDEDTAAVSAGLTTDKIITKIDFGAKLLVKGLSEPFFLVEGTQISATYRRCLRLSEGPQLIGGCVEMPHALMSETTSLRFVSYDPSGQGQPYLLAYSSGSPKWGDERWGFIIRGGGPRLFLADAMDIRCRDQF